MSSERHSTDKRVVRTKKSIKNALFKIMEKKELSDITISELTNAAGVNRRTFYTHYRCLTDILDEIESDLVTELKRISCRFDETDFENSVHELFLNFFKLMEGEFDYYFHLMRMDMRGILTSRLRNALKESATPAAARSTYEFSDKNKNIVSAFFAGGFLAFFMEWYYSENRIPPEDAATIVSQLAAGCMRVAKEKL